MKKIETLSIDIETFSSISLRDCGVYKYCQSDDFEVLLFSYSINNEEVITIDLAQGEAIPNEVLEALEDENITKWAFNAQFERVCLSKYLNKYLEPNSWRCSMVWCASMGLPLSLELAGEVLGTNIRKMKEGKDLIKYFSIPCKPRKVRGYKTRNMPKDDPFKWMKFKEYNKVDVEVEMAIKDKLKNYPMPDFEWGYYVLDQKINDTGILLDIDLVDAAIKADEINKEELLKRLKEITNLNNPNSVQQLTGWLKREGIETDSLDKKAVSKLMEEVDESIKEVLTLKQLLGKTSVKKYHAMENACGNDNRARGLIQFNGATRTGRFAGRLVQVQNLPQNHIEDLKNARALIKEGKYKEIEMLYDSVPEVLSELIRTAFIPKDNHKFIVSDFSAIEARVIAWLAGEKWRIELFKNGEDIYCKSASKMFKVPVEKHGVNSELRQKGKIAELACIAENELVLTDKGLVPIQDIKMEHKLWDGNKWVKHEGLVYIGVKEVIEYEGLRATKDHLVWVKGKQKPIQLIEAATSGSHLLQAGNGRRAIRMGKNYKLAEKMEQELESLLCPYSMSRMWKNRMAKPRKSKNREIERMPELFSTKENTKLVRKKVNGSKTKMQKSQGSKLHKLWRKRNKVDVSFSNRSRSMDTRKCTGSIKRERNRQDKYKWKLRKGKYTICYQIRKSEQQTKCSFNKMGAEILALCKNCCYKKAIKRHVKERNNRGCGESCFFKKEKLAINRGKVRVYDIRNAGDNNRFTVSNVLVHNCGYGGSVGALTAMGALDMGLKEKELQPLVNSWRESNPAIVNLWWSVDNKVKETIKTGAVTSTHGIKFSKSNDLLEIHLPSGRSLKYINPKIGVNKFGGESVQYEGIGSTKKWEKQESYGPKFVENIVQALSRDILCFALMNIYKAGFNTVMHVHDETVVEVPLDIKVDDIVTLMKQNPPWAKGLPLNAEGFECEFYKKD